MDGYVVMDHRAQRFISQWEFNARAPDEISFKPGERFQILERTGEWWLATKLDASGNQIGKPGYVPHNYLAEEGSVEEQPWYFGEVSRTEAVNLLMNEGNGTGSFLIRASDKQGFPYALSVRSEDSVKHFKILKNTKGEYHLSSVSSFPNLMKLIEYFYTKTVCPGLTLTSPCVKNEPPVCDLTPLPLDEWERSRDEFTFVKRLGSGNFAQVHEGYWKGRIQMKVAIKTIKHDMTTREIFKKETSFLKTLHHRNLLSLYAVCSVGDPYYIVTELMPKGDLLNFLRDGEGNRLAVDALLDIALQIVEGMHYLETQNCIHRDLAARNVLVGHNNLCKVADFGLARIVKDDFYLSNSIEVPYKWTALEALLYGRYTTKSDVWSYGILLYEIISRGMIPYAGMSNPELIPYLQNGQRMSAPPNCSKNIYNIMLECWKDDPKERPNFSILRGTLENLSNYELTECSPKESKFNFIRRGKR
ncbi:protein-tyrosine kinase 6 [Bombina bombina]|uniref:protein-tyrosine kinase 6 n=1 Tax=Bombina bombina TaxID=8345 RepID=UPI00235A847D|nr:protein-tyrosine kinase 6 [Bombina bombina]